MILVDTNVIVAALLGRHPHHAPSRAALTAALGSGALVATKSVVEAYSVMTRAPAPFRLAPAVAREVLERSLSTARVVTFPADAIWPLLADCAARDILGGASHDAHIAACGRHAGARRVLTWNVRDFQRVAPDLEIVSPEGV